MSYQILPREIIQEISKRLNVQDVLSQSQVSKHLYNISKNDTFWKYYVTKRYNIKEESNIKNWKDLAILLDQILLIFANAYKALPTNLFSFLIQTLIDADKLYTIQCIEEFQYFSDNNYAFYGYKYFPYNELNEIVNMYINQKYKFDFSQYETFNYIEESTGLQYFNHPQIHMKKDLLSYIVKPTEYWFGTNTFLVNFDSMFPYYEISDQQVKNYLNQYTFGLNNILFDTIYDEYLYQEIEEKN